MQLVLAFFCSILLYLEAYPKQPGDSKWILWNLRIMFVRLYQKSLLKNIFRNTQFFSAKSIIKEPFQNYFYELNRAKFMKILRMIWKAVFLFISYFEIKFAFKSKLSE